MSVLAWLDRLADEGHRSERLAARWHLGLALLCAAEVLWHLWSARRHARAARLLLVLILLVACASPPLYVCLPRVTTEGTPFYLCGAVEVERGARPAPPPIPPDAL